MGGSPISAATYDEMHLDTQAWMLTDGTHNGTTYVEGTGGIEAFIETAQATSPYSSIVVHDPAVEATAMKTLVATTHSARMVTVETAIDALDPDANWDTYAADVFTKIGVLWNETYISARVVEHQRDGFKTVSEEVGRFNNMMSQSGAAKSSQRDLGVALILSGHVDNVAKFDADLRHKHEEQKLAFVVDAASKLVQFHLSLAQIQSDTLAQRSNLSKDNISMNKIYADLLRQEIDDDLRVNVEDALWDLKLYDFAGKGLASIGGASIIPADNRSLNMAAIGLQAAGIGISALSLLSDERTKRNIQPLEGSLDKLMKLHGVSFEYKPGYANYEDFTDGPQVGIIAQEVIKVFPEWVREVDNDLLVVYPKGFEGVAIEAIRELRGEIVALKEEVEVLRKERS